MRTRSGRPKRNDGRVRHEHTDQTDENLKLAKKSEGKKTKNRRGTKMSDDILNNLGKAAVRFVDDALSKFEPHVRGPFALARPLVVVHTNPMTAHVFLQDAKDQEIHRVKGEGLPTDLMDAVGELLTKGVNDLPSKARLRVLELYQTNADIVVAISVDSAEVLAYIDSEGQQVELFRISTKETLH